MYAVDDEIFEQARAIVVALAGELDAQAPAVRHAVDLDDLVRRSAPMGLHALADRLQKTFPIEELFPRKRRPARH